MHELNMRVTKTRNSAVLGESVVFSFQPSFPEVRLLVFD